MASIDTEVLKAGLVEYFEIPEIKAKFDAMVGDGFQLSDFSKAVGIAMMAIGKVEQIVSDAGEVGQGGAKHDAVVEWADDCIKLPIWAEPFDDNVISMAVNAICTMRNVVFGRAWLEIFRKYI